MKRGWKGLPVLMATVLLLLGCAQQGQQAFVPPSEPQPAFGNYVAGRFAHNVGDPRAADFLLEAVRQDPDNRVILQRAFMALLTTGRIKEAATLARRLQTPETGSDLAGLVLTLTAFKDGRYGQARAHFEQLSGGGLQTLIAPVLSAWIHVAQREREAALAALEPFRNLRGLRPFEASNRAFIHDYLGEVDRASAAYEQLLEDRRLSSLQPVVAYGALLQRSGRHAKALSLLRQFMDGFPGNGFLQRAHERLVSNKPIKSFAATPEGAVSLILFRAAGELEQDELREPALVYAQLAAYLTPRMSEARLRLASLLRETERYEAALDELAHVERTDPLYSEAKIQSAWVYEASGSLEAAVGLMREYLGFFPDDAQAWATLGDIYRTNEKFADAAQAYDAALKLQTSPESAAADTGPALWFLYFTRGIAYERLGEWEKAEADLQQSLDLNPDQAQVLNYLGYSWIDRGMNLERGTEMIKRAVELRPRDGFIIDSLGWAFYLRGDYESAVRYLERAVQLEPTDPTINDHLGDAYWKVGRRIEARFQWRHALASDPEPEDRSKIAEKLDYGLELAAAEPAGQ